MSQGGFQQSSVHLSSSLALHEMVTSGTTCYMVGGSTNGTGSAAGAVATIQAAAIASDGSLGTFKTVGFMPAPRIQGDAIVASGHLVQLGGQDTTGTSQQTIFVAKIDNNGALFAFKTYTFPKATMIGHRLSFAKGYMFVIGGGASNNTECYMARFGTDGTFGAWTRVTDLPAALSYHDAFADENGTAIFVTGGIVGTTVQDSIYRAFVNSDGTLGKWAFVGSMTTPRWRHASLIIGNRLYSFGGSPDNVANSALASSEFITINQSDWTVGKQTPTGALFASIRNAEASFVSYFSNGKIVVCGGHLSSGNSADTISVANVQGDGHI